MLSRSPPDGLARQTWLETTRWTDQHLLMTKPNPFKWFNTSLEIIRLAVIMYVRFLLSLRNVEDLLHERGVDGNHETLRYW